MLGSTRPVGAFPVAKTTALNSGPQQCKRASPAPAVPPQLSGSAEEKKQQDFCLVPCPKPWRRKSLGQIMGCQHPHLFLCTSGARLKTENWPQWRPLRLKRKADLDKGRGNGRSLRSSSGRKDNWMVIYSRTSFPRFLLLSCQRTGEHCSLGIKHSRAAEVSAIPQPSI